MSNKLKPFIAYSELTNEIYIVKGREKYCVTNQAIKAVIAIQALEKESILDKIRAEIFNLANSNTYRKYQQKDNFGLMRAVQIIDKYRESEG